MSGCPKLRSRFNNNKDMITGGDTNSKATKILQKYQKFIVIAQLVVKKKGVEKNRCYGQARLFNKQNALVDPKSLAA
jgi:hypothetical protein